MPVHRIQRAGLDDEIAKIERSGETVITVVADGMSHLLVFTKPSSRVELRFSGPETAA
jgi:hypothetical protein